MIRYAFKMKLRPEYAEDYKHLHDEIPHELIRAHEEAGISDYTIFLDEEIGTLFATMKLKDHNQLEALAENEVVRKWWSIKTHMMEYDGDRPATTPLRELFHMD
mgnify:CR=1 FL=1